MKIVFCGDSFPEMPAYLTRALNGVHEIIVWDGTPEKMPTDIDVLIPRALQVGGAEMDRGNVKFIQQFGVGLDGVDVTAARARGIPVANVPGARANAESVAEHAILLLLMLLRQSNKSRENVFTGILGGPTGKALAGRTVCLYGLGSVARAIAKRIKAFDVRLLGLTREASSKKASELHLDRCYSIENSEACLSETDILIVCVRHGPETNGLIGDRELRNLRPGAMVVNIARAGLIDRQALQDCLADGQIGGVAMDVFWMEPASPADSFLNNPDVIVTPHVAGITDRSLTELAIAVAENIGRFEMGKKVLNAAE